MRHHAVRLRLLVPACLALALAGAGPAGAADPHPHSHHHSHGLPEEADAANLPPPPAGLVASHEDRVSRAGPDLMAWSTHWRLCWEAPAGAKYYEMRLITSEGAPRRFTRLDETCYRIEVAAGKNPPRQGFPRRDLMLAMQAAQASVQIRAVLADDTRTAWTPEQPVGLVNKPPR